MLLERRSEEAQPGAKLVIIHSQSFRLSSFAKVMGTDGWRSVEPAGAAAAVRVDREGGLSLFAGSCVFRAASQLQPGQQANATGQKTLLCHRVDERETRHCLKPCRRVAGVVSGPV